VSIVIGGDHNRERAGALGPNRATVRGVFIVGATKMSLPAEELVGLTPRR